MQPDKIVDMLVALIKFDMQQIQNYRETIIYISVTIIAFSFGISAFALRKDAAIIENKPVKDRFKIVFIADLFILLMFDVMENEAPTHLENCSLCALSDENNG